MYNEKVRKSINLLLYCHFSENLVNLVIIFIIITNQFSSVIIKSLDIFIQPL